MIRYYAEYFNRIGGGNPEVYDRDDVRKCTTCLPSLTLTF